jgi:hypothetical protein
MRWWFAFSGRRRAFRVCSSCSVRNECLGYSLEHGEDSGIWGGLTAAEQRALLEKATRCPATSETFRPPDEAAAAGRAARTPRGA